MKYIRKIFSILAVLLSVVSCQDFSTDLNVENLENPNDFALTSDPVALTATAGTLFNNWFITANTANGPGPILGTMADVQSCSWGNFGMRDFSSEPRVAMNNSSSYGNAFVTNSYFNGMYSVLSDSNTLALAVQNETDFADSNQILTVAKFGQALTIGYLALVFDRVWLSDENGVVEGSLENGASDYKEAMAFALKKLDEAIAIATANDVSFPEAWLPSNGGNSPKLVAFMNSMGARMLVNNARNTAQKGTLDWNKVITYTNKGLTSDLTIYADNITWYDTTQFYQTYVGWGRVDMRIVQMMDPDMPSYWTDNLTVVPESAYGPGVDNRLKTDYGYKSAQDFIPARGAYHFSNYRYKRYDNYIAPPYQDDLVEFSKAENDMYKAEALALTGKVADAASIINAGTRVTRGLLAPVAADLTAVKKAIFHERMVEFSYTGMGIGFFEMRKENLLQAGTLLHFPVPGAALESIPQTNYTYGGTTGIPGEDYSNGGWR